VQRLSQQDQKIAEEIAPILKHEGILIAGLDIIGNYLTEINITSPTCFQEITNESDSNPAKILIDSLI
jgi:glutathione synthase